jgi:hypothetical protein
MHEKDVTARIHYVRPSRPAILLALATVLGGCALEEYEPSKEEFKASIDGEGGSPEQSEDAPSVRAASCFRCNGVDPNTNGCTGTTTVREFTAAKTSIRVELRFSGACGGAWARETQPGNNRYGTTLFLEDNTGTRYTHDIRFDSQEWTLMMDWARTLRACYQFGDDPRECTSWW